MEISIKNPFANNLPSIDPPTLVTLLATRPEGESTLPDTIFMLYRSRILQAAHLTEALLQSCHSSCRRAVIATGMNASHGFIGAHCRRIGKFEDRLRALPKLREWYQTAVAVHQAIDGLINAAKLKSDRRPNFNITRAQRQCAVIEESMLRMRTDLEEIERNESEWRAQMGALADTLRTLVPIDPAEEMSTKRVPLWARAFLYPDSSEGKK